MARPTRARPEAGLPALRRGGAVADLLFLYDCATEESSRLRPIAERLGITVQAASHAYRQLARRGLVEVRDGLYRPTVLGVSWLHASLGALADDLFDRQKRLPIVRSLRALAGVDLARGDPVRLELVEGRLTALRGRTDASRGRVGAGARAGELVEVGELEGILAIAPAEVTILTVPAARLGDPSLSGTLRRALTPRPPGLIGARGLEAIHLAERAGVAPVTRFAAGAAAAEAASLGVPSTLLVLDEELPRLLGELAGSGRPRVSVRPLSTGRVGRGRSRPRREPRHEGR